MFKKLILRDFKTHKDTVLEFSPGVNVITGDTGQGKTNILLALTCVKDNRPLGSGWIRRGQDGGAIVLEVTDGEKVCSITRSRSKSKNEYGIEKNGVCIDPIKAGSSPPTEVSEILNLSDINIQKQRDKHFLVYSPPGQVATYVRSITKLDDIDLVIKLLSGKIHSERGEVSHCQKEFKSTEDKLIVLNKIDLVLFEAMIIDTKNRILKNEQIKEKIERIRIITKALKTLEEHWIVIPDNVDTMFEDVDFVQESMTKISSRLSKLKTLVDQIRKIEVREIVLPEDLTILSTVESVSEKFGNQCKRLDKLVILDGKLRVVIVKIDDYDRQIQQVEDEERLLKEQLEVCPSCETKLTEESKIVLLEK